LRVLSSGGQLSTIGSGGAGKDASGILLAALGVGGDNGGMGDTRTFLGLYTGPAADGIDAALVTIRGTGASMRVEQTHCLSRMLGEGERRRSLAFAGGHSEPCRVLAELDRDLGISAAAMGKLLLDQAGLDAKQIEAVGWSGQPIAYEAPGASNPLGGGLTLGSPAILAHRLGASVVSGFAASDLAAGGLGGSMTTWCDWQLFRHERLSRVAVHLGGVATLTAIPAQAQVCDVVAFDAGPGTMVLDALAHKFHNKPYDTDGAMAAAGRAAPMLVHELLAHPYYHREIVSGLSPKRVCLADWSQAYVWRVLQAAGKQQVAEGDLLAVISEVTAQTIARAIAQLTERPDEVILTGGGAKNIHLAGRIRQLLCPSSTVTCIRQGIALEAKQAVCMAMLAAARLDGVKAHCPQATGATQSKILGSVWLA